MMLFLRDARLWIVGVVLAVVAAGVACVPDIDELPEGPADAAPDAKNADANI